MKNSRLPNRMGYLLMVSSLMALFLLHIGISTSFADDLVKKTQQSLVEKGFDPGPVDGFWGPRTKSGVMEFQKKEGLTVNGRLDDATKKSLFATAESPPSNVKIAKEPVMQENPKAPVVPEMKEKEEPKAKESPKQMAETPAPVTPPKVEVAKAPKPKKEVLSSAVKPSGPCPQKKEKPNQRLQTLPKWTKQGVRAWKTARKYTQKPRSPWPANSVMAIRAMVWENLVRF